MEFAEDPLSESEAEEVFEALSNVFKRPGMYWGTGDNHFYCFNAFMFGYSLGRDNELPENVHRLADYFLPKDFTQFVTEYFGHEYPYGGHGWMTLIEEKTDTWQEAFDLFFQLRIEYQKACKAATAKSSQ